MHEHNNDSMMKSSNQQWLGDIPSSWETTKLKRVFEIRKEIAGKEGYTILSVTQKGIRPKVMTDKGQFSLDYSKYQMVSRGQFIMNHMDLLTGWVDVSNYDGVTSPDYRVFSNTNPQKYNSNYYRYIFQLCYAARIFYGLGQGVAGFGRWRLPSDMFLNFVLPVPCIEEQIQIAEYLDAHVSRIDSIIEKTKNSIEDYNRWKISTINNAIKKGLDPSASMHKINDPIIGSIPTHWKLAKVKQVATINPVCDTTRLSKDDIVSFAPMDCIRTDYRIEKNSALSGNNSSYSTFIDGDIALAKVTPCFQNRNVCIMENLLNGFAFGSSELYNIRATAINRRYLLYFFMTDTFISGGEACMTGVAGLQRVPSSYVRNAVLPLPCKEEQEAIVTFLDRKCCAINQIVEEKHSLINDLEAYKRSLIYEVVTGKKRVI